MDTQNQTTMYQLIVTSTYVCGHCKRELPKEAFYFNQRKQCPDNYCKECRKRSSGKQRNNDQDFNFVNRKRMYPVITQISDSKLRMALIMQALQKIRESVEKKRKKQHEQEFNDFE